MTIASRPAEAISLRRAGKLASTTGSRTRFSRRRAVAVLASTALAAGLPLAASSPAGAAPTTRISLWAMSASADALSFSRSIVKTNGLVHSEGAISIKKSKGKLTGGVEYGSTLTRKATKIKFRPAAVKVVPGQGHPAGPVIADYRPGGAAAVAADSYTAVDPADCTDGSWSPSRKVTFTGIVYVPCNLAITGGKNRSIDATFVAEGKILVSGTRLTVGPAAAGPSLVSGATGASAILVKGAKVTTRGIVFAPAGQVRIAKTASVLICGVQAQTIAVTRSSVKVPMPKRCSA